MMDASKDMYKKLMDKITELKTTAKFDEMDADA